MGIIHETSCPRTPQPNSIIEMKHPHLLEATRCLLFSMNVPQSYWPVTLMTACSLINRMPSFVLGNKIPFSILFPIRPLRNLPPLSLWLCLLYSQFLTCSKQAFPWISTLHLPGIS